MLVLLRTSWGEKLDSAAPVSGQLGLWFLQPTDYPMLGWLDVYDDAVFNQRQMGGMLPELLRFHDEVSMDTLEHEYVVKVIDLARRCAETMDTWLEFVGD